MNSSSNVFSQCLADGGSFEECNSDSTFLIVLIEDCVNDPDDNDGIELTTEQLDVLNGLDPVQIEAINHYLDDNSCSPEAQSFLALAIDALADNDGDELPDGEVDFENEVIKDPSFIGTKADCVLKELITSGNNIFKTVSEAFTNDRSEYRLYFTVGNVQGGGVASTSLPFDDGIIRIKFSPLYVNSMSAIVTAKDILHEIIHAELHRIYINGNQGPNPLPQAQYNWYASMWEFYQYNNNGQNTVASEAEHTYMARYLIDNIASGLREFDNNAQPLLNYKGFAWEGLEDVGINASYITAANFQAFVALKSTVENDNNENNCDE
jgi:hypothetical protein